MFPSGELYIRGFCVIWKYPLEGIGGWGGVENIHPGFITRHTMAFSLGFVENLAADDPVQAWDWINNLNRRLPRGPSQRFVHILEQDSGFWRAVLRWAEKDSFGLPDGAGVEVVLAYLLHPDYVGDFDNLLARITQTDLTILTTLQVNSVICAYERGDISVDGGRSSAVDFFEDLTEVFWNNAPFVRRLFTCFEQTDGEMPDFNYCSSEVATELLQDVVFAQTHSPSIGWEVFIQERPWVVRDLLMDRDFLYAVAIYDPRILAIYFQDRSDDHELYIRYSTLVADICIDPAYVVAAVRRQFLTNATLEYHSPLSYLIPRSLTTVSDEWLLELCEIDPSIPVVHILDASWRRTGPFPCVNPAFLEQVDRFIVRVNPPPFSLQTSLHRLYDYMLSATHVSSILETFSTIRRWLHARFSANDIDMILSNIRQLLQEKSTVNARRATTRETQKLSFLDTPLDTRYFSIEQQRCGWKPVLIHQLFEQLARYIPGDLLDFEECLQRWYLDPETPRHQTDAQMDLSEHLVDLLDTAEAEAVHVYDGCGTQLRLAREIRRFSAVLCIGSEVNPGPTLPITDGWTLLAIDRYVRNAPCVSEIRPWVHPPVLDTIFSPYEVSFILCYDFQRLCMLYTTSVFLDIRRLSGLCCARLCQQWCLMQSFK